MVLDDFEIEINKLGSTSLLEKWEIRVFRFLSKFKFLARKLSRTCGFIY